jgi:hypothetical protein
VKYKTRASRRSEYHDVASVALLAAVAMKGSFRKAELGQMLTFVLGTCALVWLLWKMTLATVTVWSH